MNLYLYIPAASAHLESPKPTSIATELENNDKEERIFIHMKYHPRGIGRQQVRTIFGEICNNINSTAAKVERVTIALSHATNLKDELTSAELYQPVGKKTSTFFPGVFFQGLGRELIIYILYHIFVIFPDW